MRASRTSSMLVVLALVLVVTPAIGAEGVRTRIEEMNQRFEEALAKGDAAALAGFYSAAAEVLPPGSDVVRGPEAIRAFWKSTIDSGVTSVELTTTDVAASGDLACETGTYAMKGAGGKLLERGKYVVVYRKEEGTWRIFRDIWNAEAPAPPAPPAAK